MLSCNGDVHLLGRSHGPSVYRFDLLLDALNGDLAMLAACQAIRQDSGSIFSDCLQPCNWAALVDVSAGSCIHRKRVKCMTTFVAACAILGLSLAHSQQVVMLLENHLTNQLQTAQLIQLSANQWYAQETHDQNSGCYLRGVGWVSTAG